VTKVRTFNSEGIKKSREFIANWRTNNSFSHKDLDYLLMDPHLSAAFEPHLEVEQAQLRTRRDAARILMPLLDGIQGPIADNDGLWSWLGMYFAPEYRPNRNTTTDQYVFLKDESTASLRRAYQRRYRHALRAAYLICRQHGESAAFLLDRPLTAFSLEDRLLSDFRAFTSVGVIQLAITLYTADGELRTRYSDESTPGNLRQLLRTLNQLERTYDVYGMEADALMQILPAAFDNWKPR